MATRSSWAPQHRHALCTVTAEHSGYDIFWCAAADADGWVRGWEVQPGLFAGQILGLRAEAAPAVPLPTATTTRSTAGRRRARGVGAQPAISDFLSRAPLGRPLSLGSPALPHGVRC